MTVNEDEYLQLLAAFPFSFSDEERTMIKMILLCITFCSHTRHIKHEPYYCSHSLLLFLTTTRFILFFLRSASSIRSNYDLRACAHNFPDSP